MMSRRAPNIYLVRQFLRDMKTARAINKQLRKDQKAAERNNKANRGGQHGQ